MLPAEDFYGTWPRSGEIDVLEAVNLKALCTDCVGTTGENRTLGALHFGDFFPNNQFLSQRITLSEFENPADAYHVYSIEWGEGQVKWFVDDTLFFTVNADQWFTAAPEAAGNENAPFDRPFYIMFNLAVGGALSENNNALGFDEGSFPNQLLVDWVRVYQCGPDLATGRQCMD